MRKIRWAQIKAVIRLEIKKTFFARRGLWIYFLAALPILIFIAYGIAAANQQHRTARIAREGEKALTYQDLLAIKPGMTKEEVLRALRKPPIISTWDEPRRTDGGSFVNAHHEQYQYSDGEHDIFIGMVEGKVENVHVNEGRD